LGPTRDIGALTRHILAELAEATGETIGLAQLDPATGTAEMTTVINGVQPLHYGQASGVTIPLYAGRRARPSSPTARPAPSRPSSWRR
jgi:DNA-binding IclR family transcriptional regulator